MSVPKRNSQGEHKVHSEKSSICSGPVGTVRIPGGKENSWCQISKRQRATSEVQAQQGGTVASADSAPEVRAGLARSTVQHLDSRNRESRGKGQAFSQASVTHVCPGGGETLHLLISHPDAVLLEF